MEVRRRAFLIGAAATAGLSTSVAQAAMLFDKRSTKLHVPSIRTPRDYGLRIGVNLGGADGGVVPGVENYDWVRPTINEVNYYADRGFTLYRYCMQMPRMTQAAATNPTFTNFVIKQSEIDLVLALARRVGERGGVFILDLHNYAKLPDGTALDPTVADHVEWLAHFWELMATAFKTLSHVWYGLSNEPNVQTPAAWVQLANAAIARIATVHSTAVICVAGTYYDVADGWVTAGNAAAMANLVVPAGIVILFEAHQYGDQHGGKPEQGFPVVAGELARAEAFFLWLRANGKKGFIGEVGIGPDAAYLAEGELFLKLCEKYNDVLVGVVVWHGHKWAAEAGTRPFNVRPADLLNGPDLPQIQLLRR